MAEMKRTRVDEEILRFGDPEQLQDLAIEMAEELLELRRRVVSVSISQDDIDTLQAVIDIDFADSSDSRQVVISRSLTRILTALRSRP